MKRLLVRKEPRLLRYSNPGPRDPKLGVLSAPSLLLCYGYVLGRGMVLKCVWNAAGV